MDSLVERLAKILEPFRSMENAESDRLFREDEVARKILSVWPELSLTLREPMVLGTVPEHRHNQWKYAWGFRKIDYRDLEKATGIENRSVLREKIDLLMKHQMIYPDGSLSRTARALVAA